MNLLTAIWISLMAGLAGYIVIDGILELYELLKTGLNWEEQDDE